MSPSINTDELLNSNDILIYTNNRISIRMKERGLRVRVEER